MEVGEAGEAVDAADDTAQPPVHLAAGAADVRGGESEAAAGALARRHYSGGYGGGGGWAGAGAGVSGSDSSMAAAAAAAAAEGGGGQNGAWSTGCHQQRASQDIPDIDTTDQTIQHNHSHSDTIFIEKTCDKLQRVGALA